MNDAADVEEEPVLPPQIFNDEEYVGVSASSLGQSHASATAGDRG